MPDLRLPLATLVAAAALAACGPSGSPPVIGNIDDPIVGVNQELVLLITASDPDGDALSYRFEAEADSIRRRASIGVLPNGAAEFRWTPLAADVGVWPLDVLVSDGGHSARSTLSIDVRSAIGDGTEPSFIHPQGAGTTLDLAASGCLTLPVEVVDPDTADVTLQLADPLVEGAELVQLTGTTAELSWCPSPMQIEADDRYTLVFAADDGENPRSLHAFMIVLLHPGGKPDCPGEAPVVTHVPEDASTLVGLTIAAEIEDDVGLKREPLLYWSLTPPGTPPELGGMSPVPMLLIDGAAQDGVWAADVPNPVVELSAGDRRTLHYVVVATDDDDHVGACDHTTMAPDTGSYAMDVIHPGGEGSAPICAPCSDDAQCGGVADLCVAQGGAGGAFCLAGCGAGDACPDGTTCSTAAVTSVGGVVARQCVPTTGACGAPHCVDDGHEDDDGRLEALAANALEPGAYELVSCPAATGGADDEDWFRLVLDGDATITLELVGGDASDLDLRLTAADGSELGASLSFTSTEKLTRCLPAGEYLARVQALHESENPYTLTYARTGGTCAAVCADDGNEDDDAVASARQISIRPPHTATGQAICTGDDDWYRVALQDGEHLRVDLTFDQSSSAEDLDIHLMDEAGIDLTPCSPLDDVASCDFGNGQSADANERFDFTAPTAGCAPCRYFVVVRGYNGAADSYDITLQGTLP